MHQRRKEIAQLTKARYAGKTVLDGALTKSVLYAATAGTPRSDKTLMTPTLVHEMLKAWINKPQKVSKALCFALDNLIYTMCRSFATHLVLNGMYMHLVDVEQMGGSFMSKHMVATIVVQTIPIIGSQTVCGG